MSISAKCPACNKALPASGRCWTCYNKNRKYCKAHRPLNDELREYNISKEVLIYWAGYFDGEGCVGEYTRKDGSKQYQASISQKTENAQVIEEMAEIYDVTVHVDKKEMSHVTITGVRCLEFLRDISPYLRQKQKKAKWLITRIEEAREKRNAHV